MSVDQPGNGLRLILGSGSPRRLDLLAQIGVVPDRVSAPDIDETPRKGENPEHYVSRMALEKAAAVDIAPDEIVLSADTTVFAGRRILGKPEDATEAEAFLRLLSGRRHKVSTAVAVRSDARVWSKRVTTSVRMKSLSETEIASYLATDDWRGKAGGYGIQGAAGHLIPWISGSFTGVVGLPLAETAALLSAAGFALP